MTRLPLLLLALALSAGACSDDAAAPRAGAGDASADSAAVGLDPRLVLFDVQTRLEGAHAGTGAYPTVGEFTLADEWGLQRELLDAAFDEWRYSREGEGYRLAGSTEGKQYDVTSPAG